MATTDLEAAHSAREATGSGAWRFASQLLARADVIFNGPRPWDMQIHDPQVPERVLAFGNLGLGESYMDEQWDCEQLDEFFAHVLHAHLDDDIDPSRLVFHALKARLMNRQTVRRGRSASSTTTSATLFTRRCSTSA
jgi:cyclopropane-fatty-acyl-phospholipid synthase